MLTTILYTMPWDAYYSTLRPYAHTPRARTRLPTLDKLLGHDTRTRVLLNTYAY